MCYEARGFERPLLFFLMYDNKKEITKKYILDTVGEVAIFMRYLNLPHIRDEEMICNPLRADKNPTASFKWVNDRIQFRDWSETFSRDCFNVAQLVTRKRTFYDTLIQIAVDFNLVNGAEYTNFVPINVDEQLAEIRKHSEKKEIKVVVKDWHRVDLEFWKQIGVTKEFLKKFNVFSIGEAYIDGELIYRWNRTDIGFAFYFGNGDFKLYFPNRKKGNMKFVHNNANLLQGYNQLPETGDHCVITKSFKDVIAFRMTDIISVAPMSEVIPIGIDQYLDLKDRFKNLFVLYDNDWPGRKATIKLIKEFNDIVPILFPQGEPKDYTDNIKIYGINDMIDQVNHYKQKLLNE